MRLIKIPFVLLAVVVGLAAVFILLGLLGTTSAVLAQEQELPGPMNLAPRMRPEERIDVTIVLSDPLRLVTIEDLVGNPVTEGLHIGEVKCKGDKCSKGTDLCFSCFLTDTITIDYKPDGRQALDPEARAVVVAGTGTIVSDGQKERFAFTATFEDNGDGTILVTYVASRSDASFRIPKSPGTFEITFRSVVSTTLSTTRSSLSRGATPSRTATTAALSR